MTCTGTGSCNQGRAQCRDGCTNLIQTNSDGSDPYGEARELIDLALDFALAVLAVGCVIFTVFSLIGFWSNK